MIFVPIETTETDDDRSCDNSVDRNEEPLLKKQKADVVTAETVSINANDFVTLIFVDFCEVTSSRLRLVSSKCQYHHHMPTYTHQIFEEEKIDFLSDSLQKAFVKSHQLASIDIKNQIGREKEPGLLIYINCDDLSHYATTRSMTLQDDREKLITKIHTFLPPNSNYQKNTDDDYHLPIENRPQNVLPSNPSPGKLLSTFEVNSTSKGGFLNPDTVSSTTFELFLATDKDSGAGDLLRRAEKIAIWHIETADSVDFSDERWEVTNLYNVQTINNCSTRCFAGYMTLFTFNNPFLGSKIRVCQALVLPHMQGLGLGRNMLLAVYDLARSRSSIVEVTVEDPAPAFERLRDAVDCEWVLLHLFKQFEQSKLNQQNEENIGQHPAVLDSAKDSEKDGAEDSVTSCLLNELPVMRMKGSISESSNVTQLAEKERCRVLKLTAAQTCFAYEALQYAVLCLSFTASQQPVVAVVAAEVGEERINPPGGPSEDAGDPLSSSTSSTSSSLQSSPEYKSFRLKVKRRILNANKYLKSLTTPMMQRGLDQLFEELRVRYEYCLEPIKRIQI